MFADLQTNHANHHLVDPTQNVMSVERHLHAPVCQTTLDFHQTADPSARSILSVRHILPASSKSVVILVVVVAESTLSALSSITTRHVRVKKVSVVILTAVVNLPARVSPIIMLTFCMNFNLSCMHSR